MDDYGTGYSSIDLLSQWPFSVVKIDKEMIHRMLSSNKSTTIVQSSIHMAHQLGIDVVAEGIESAEVYNFLLNAGCTVAQGFWLSKPIPLSDFLTFIKRDKRWSGLPIGLIHMAQLDHIQWRRSLVDKVMAMAFSEPRIHTVQRIEAELDHRNCKLVTMRLYIYFLDILIIADNKIISQDIRVVSLDCHHSQIRPHSLTLEVKLIPHLIYW